MLPSKGPYSLLALPSPRRMRLLSTKRRVCMKMALPPVLRTTSPEKRVCICRRQYHATIQSLVEGVRANTGTTEHEARVTVSQALKRAREGELSRMPRKIRAHLRAETKLKEAEAEVEAAKQGSPSPAATSASQLWPDSLQYKRSALLV